MLSLSLILSHLLAPSVYTINIISKSLAFPDLVLYSDSPIALGVQTSYMKVDAVKGHKHSLDSPLPDHLKL